MQFPNAFNCAKKLFTAEILQLIAAVFVGCCVVLAMAAASANQAGAGEGIVAGAAIGMAGFLFVGLILGLIGQILMLVGLWQGGKDEPNYLKKAFWFTIVMIVLSCISGAMTGTDGQQSVAASFVELLSFIASLVVFNFIVEGLGQLGQRAGSPELLAFGHKIMGWLSAAVTCVLIVTIASNFINQTVAGIAGIAALVLAVMVYIGYLVFLSRAKKALA